MSATLRNHSTAAFLLNSDVRGIKVEYERSGTTYLFKSLDPTLKVGDLVVVPTKFEAPVKSAYQSAAQAAAAVQPERGQLFTVVKVVEVDVDPDYDGDVQYKWIAAKFDPSDYEKTLEREKDALMQVKRAEVRRRREELAGNIFADREAMKQIPFAKVEDPPKFGDDLPVSPVKPPDWPRHG